MASKRMTGWNDKRESRTLACLLQHMEGFPVVVELKDYSALQGTLGSCEASMNLELKDVTVYGFRRQNKPCHFDHFYVLGKFIRFVHFEQYFNPAKIIHEALNTRQMSGRVAAQRRAGRVTRESSSSVRQERP